jgi:hypothetical protein
VRSVHRLSHHATAQEAVHLLRTLPIPRVKTLGQRVVHYHLSKELADQATMYGDQCLADVDLGTDKLRSGIDRDGA